MGAKLFSRSRQAPAEETPAFGGIAERFRRAGDLDRAIALCRDGLKKFPNQLSAKVTLGWALLDKGDYEGARAELEQVLRRAPDNLAAIRGLAELHERAENSMDAAAWHRQHEEAARPEPAHVQPPASTSVIAALGESIPVPAQPEWIDAVAAPALFEEAAPGTIPEAWTVPGVPEPAFARAAEPEAFIAPAPMVAEPTAAAPIVPKPVASEAIARPPITSEPMARTRPVAAPLSDLIQDAFGTVAAEPHAPTALSDFEIDPPMAAATDDVSLADAPIPIDLDEPVDLSVAASGLQELDPVLLDLAAAESPTMEHAEALDELAGQFEPIADAPAALPVAAFTATPATEWSTADAGPVFDLPAASLDPVEEEPSVIPVAALSPIDVPMAPAAPVAAMSFPDLPAAPVPPAPIVRPPSRAEARRTATIRRLESFLHKIETRRLSLAAEPA